MIDDSLHYLTSMNPDVLEELMERYGQEVWNFAFFLTRNRSMADDVAQDVFLQAYRNLDSFRGESSVKTWLLRITRNISFNYRNTAFIRKVLLMDAVFPTGHSGSAEQQFMEQEATNEVWKMIFQLPVKHREVLMLHARHQLSIEEIGHILNVPEGTVKSRLFNARKRMSRLMKEEETINGTIYS